MIRGVLLVATFLATFGTFYSFQENIKKTNITSQVCVQQNMFSKLINWQLHSKHKIINIYFFPVSTLKYDTSLPLELSINTGADTAIWTEYQKIYFTQASNDKVQLRFLKHLPILNANLCKNNNNCSNWV